MKVCNVLFLLVSVAVLFSCRREETSQATPDSALRTQLIQVPMARQAANYTCGVAALQSVLHYYGDEWRQDRLSLALKADSVNGTNYRNIIHLCDSLGYTTKVHTRLSIDSLKAFIDLGFPMILAIQAWAESPEKYAEQWDSGHYVVCIGYDHEKIYFMDPSTIGNYTFIPVNEFVDRWHDIDQGGIKLYNFALQISKSTPTYKPEEILKMD
jgi:ABC-type bacteriocin/lantibiotic exporter with double-glycine peptidase domain